MAHEEAEQVHGATSSKRRSAGRPAGLQLPEISSRAMNQINELGVEQFSMRRLASDLGVTPMSLYHHVRSKDALMLLLQRSLLSMIATSDRDDAWDVRLRHTMTRTVAVGRRFPKLALHTIEHPSFMSLDDPLFADISDALLAGGIPPERLNETMTWLISFLAGVIMMEGTQFHNKIDPDTEPDSGLAVELIIGAVAGQIEKYRTDVG